jgi:hypothetical protein
MRVGLDSTKDKPLKKPEEQTIRQTEIMQQ